MALLTSVIAAIAVLVAVEEALSEPALLLAAAVFGALFIAFLRLARVVVRADEHGVMIRNVWSRHEVSWHQVTDIRIGRHPWLGRICTIDLNDGRTITCTAITVPNVELRPGRGWRQHGAANRAPVAVRRWAR